MAGTDVKICDECGASVYPEHIGAQKAGYRAGKLFCVHCFAEHRESQIVIGVDEVASPTTAAAASPSVPTTKAVTASTDDDELLSLDLGPEPAPSDSAVAGNEKDLPVSAAGDENTGAAKSASAMIKPLSTGRFGATALTTAHKFKRHPHHDELGAIRCRIFHAKLNEGALKFMQDQINEWIDDNADITVKHVGTNVGIVEGKSPEPHLVVTVFY